MDPIAAAALALGVVNSLYAVLWPRWRDRAASFEIRSELLGYPTRHAWQEDERLVLVNHGPSPARGVTVIAYDHLGNLFGDAAMSLWPEMPIPLVHAGQSVHLKMSTSLADGVPARAVVTWRDSRRALQEQEFHLSYHRVT